MFPVKRTQVSLRVASPEDAPVLAEVWSEIVRRADREQQIADLEAIIARVTPLDDERIVVAEYDGQVAGAVHLRASTLTPLNLEPVVQAISPHVLPQFRRRGVGRTLMEAAVAFAEERGIAHIATAAVSGSRDANRFMARLALGPFAVLRLAPTAMVQAKLDAQAPAGGLANGRSGTRQLTHVLAARRSTRRAQRRRISDLSS
ncbi:MAG TPA: GNAT family N-acetyltransferase [Nocardioides sp.]|nr:GNAT family N-acetyltransferase [Nocardioides sp.]